MTVPTWFFALVFAAVVAGVLYIAVVRPRRKKAAEERAKPSAKV